MGKFGIPISAGDWSPSADTAIRAPALTAPAAPVVHVANLVVADYPKPQRSIDRALAWMSYFVLVFAAFCVFLPAQTQQAAAAVNSLTHPVIAPVLNPMVSRISVPERSSAGWNAPRWSHGKDWNLRK